MVLQFYYDNLSQPCRAVYILLKAAGVDFEAKEISLMKGEQLKPEFGAKCAIAKVPLIEDDGFVLAESAAISRYIAVKKDLPDHWYPRADAKKQARVDEFLHWQHMNIRKPEVTILLNVYRSRIALGVRFPKKPFDPEVIKAATEDLKKGIKLLDEYFLQDRQFIAGDDISAADLICVNELVQLEMVEYENVYTCNERVAAWVQRVRDRTQPHFDEACQKMNAAAAAFKAAAGEEGK